ncbi:hypothetical protein BO82DRAFT_400690 [Aspergillus uvarum CBS 121591]|uniref:Uncharacterized protein n=1 Tax=Aspergillus uvarum CBS 121591 TaxID=1448315 RepID=A0A319D5U9_9EURO|nr:hypothetical protein BO82DRAFT_400690 [Aspergillus uvarum CBS 121591]PYH83298.1 hypothetical protein BO82DRAFT_400690 [Aspergillus uvarum CBS 121591]
MHFVPEMPGLSPEIEQMRELYRNGLLNSLNMGSRAPCNLQQNPTAGAFGPAGQYTQLHYMEGFLPTSKASYNISISGKTRFESFAHVAVIGTGLRLPGGVTNSNRFDQEDLESWKKTGVEGAYFLTGDIARFNAAMFRISPEEAQAMDPRLLQVVSKV